MKIAVYAIALNEEAFAERFMDSCREADLVLVADTGSTDRTVEKLTAAGADVRHIEIKPWRFDQARNAALALLPQDIDFCVSLDLDQTLAPGWREVVEQAHLSGANQLRYTHVFSHAGHGREWVFEDDRIHARHGFEWRYPCHECLVPTPGFTPRRAVDARVRVLHDPDRGKSRSYLPLLELGAAERPNDPRCAHYLGREYIYLHRHQDAVREFERQLALPPESGEYETSASRRLLAHCHEILGDDDRALAEFQAAADDEPHSRGAWVSLAWAWHRRQNWEACLRAAERAIAIRDENDYGDDTSPGVVVEDLACLASWSLGHPWTALDYGRDALAKAPGNARIRANLQRIEKAMAQEGPKQFGVSLAPLTAEAPAKQRRARARARARAIT